MEEVAGQLEYNPGVYTRQLLKNVHKKISKVSAKTRKSKLSLAHKNNVSVADETESQLVDGFQEILQTSINTNSKSAGGFRHQEDAINRLKQHNT